MASSNSGPHKEASHTGSSRDESAYILREFVSGTRVLYGVTKLINPYGDHLISLYVVIMCGNEPAGLHSVTAQVATVLNLPYHPEWDAVQAPSQQERGVVGWLAHRINGELGISQHLRGVDL